jgi:hypothetical protein
MRERPQGRAKRALGAFLARLRACCTLGAMPTPAEIDARRMERTLAAIRARCAQNAEIARTDPDRRRVTVSIALRTEAQLAAQRRQRG